MRNAEKGFTLVEIMVVVVIIGLIATMALPAFFQARQNSQNTRLMNDLRVFAGQIETFALETGEFPEDSNTGDIPSGFGPYIKVEQWAEGPSIGGQWDVELDSFGITSAVGVVGYTVPEEQILKFDSRFDDGNLTTGFMRKLQPNRYYYIVQE